MVFALSHKYKKYAETALEGVFCVEFVFLFIKFVIN